MIHDKKMNLLQNILFAHEKNPSPPSFLTIIYKLWKKWQTGLMVFLEKAREYTRPIEQKTFTRVMENIYWDCGI